VQRGCDHSCSCVTSPQSKKPSWDQMQKGRLLLSQKHRRRYSQARFLAGGNGEQVCVDLLRDLCLDPPQELPRTRQSLRLASWHCEPGQGSEAPGPARPSDLREKVWRLLEAGSRLARRTFRETIGNCPQFRCWKTSAVPSTEPSL
jgi:hypothetical protein